MPTLSVLNGGPGYSVGRTQYILLFQNYYVRFTNKIEYGNTTKMIADKTITSRYLQ